MVIRFVLEFAFIDLLQNPMNDSSCLRYSGEITEVLVIVAATGSFKPMLRFTAVPLITATWLTHAYNKNSVTFIK